MVQLVHDRDAVIASAKLDARENNVPVIFFLDETTQIYRWTIKTLIGSILEMAQRGTIVVIHPDGREVPIKLGNPK